MLYSEIKNTNILYLLNLLNKQKQLTTILNSISDWVEDLIPEVTVSIMLLTEDKEHLRLISTRNKFSKNYQDVINNLKIGPEVGSCGAAAYLKKMVICEDLTTHPNWATFRNYIKSEKIAACWSVPIINTEGMLYGTFGIYYKKIKSPVDSEVQKLYEIAALIALCLDFYYERENKNALYEQYHSFYDHHPAAIYEHDINGVILNFNETAKKHHGDEINQIIGTNYLNYFPNQYQDEIKFAFSQARLGNIQQLETLTYDLFGQTYYIDLTYMPIFKNKEVIAILAIAKDISTQYNLKQNLKLLKRGIDSSPNGLTILTKDDSDYHIVYANPAFLEMTGFTHENILNNNCKFLEGPETDLISIQNILNAIQNNKSLNVTLKNYKKDGTWFWNQLTLNPVLDKNHNCTHFICTQQDVTKELLDQEYILFQQTHDNLTHLINRQMFEKKLEESFKQSEDDLVILYIDLDDFKTVNKDLGYANGDEVITQVAKRLKVVLNDYLLSRFSSDSFAVLINKATTKEQILLLVEDIFKNLALPFYINHQYIRLTTSIGISDRNEIIKNSKELLYSAIQAMYEAKKEQANTWNWHVTNKKENGYISEIQMRHDLTLALREKQFQLHYQPIIDSQTQRIVGVEALIRWYHPDRGLISPAHFIPMAERSGQIFEIGAWVVEQALKNISKINRGTKQQLQVSINISPLQFKSPYFLNMISKLLSLYQFPPELLKVEITEGIFMMESEYSLKILQELQKLGIKVSIDDFGTEYSSLSYLRRFPVNQIKLDKSFIDFITTRKKDAVIVTSLIQMAKSLELQVVAEGVETKEQMIFLTENQCDLLQGYYFSKPIPIDDLENLII